MIDFMQWGIEAAERGLAPDALIRHGIRGLCRARLRAETGDPRDRAEAARKATSWFDGLKSSPIAIATDKANEQHYELPSEFFATVLGPRLKYSCCYFESDASTLADAEQAALAITCERAELADGQEILELGCGWGSLSVWMAEHYPQSRITAVSNSTSQRAFIEARRDALGLTNLRVVTADVNHLEWEEEAFDRVVSVEMFEHLRNYDRVLERIHRWLRAEGKLFVHLFCHRRLAYAFSTAGAANWMGRHFFTGGMMPSADLLPQFNRHLVVARRHEWNGRHYQRTAEAWLANLDRHRDQALHVLRANYGKQEASRWFQRWRMFFLAVAELFGYEGGEQWFVSHYLLEKSAASLPPDFTAMKATFDP